MRILMVCLGNICRSPMAEGILKAKVEKMNLDVVCDSAGTSDYHIGEPPDERARECMKRHGQSIENLRARQFQVDDFENFDMIYAMDASNYNNILKLARTDDDQKKVVMILNESQPNRNMQVPDPYFGGDAGFDQVYGLLDAACDAILEKMSHD